MKLDGAEIYPVGVLHAIQRAARAFTVRHPGLRGKRLHLARAAIRYQLHYLARQAKAGNWRAVRNAFNGYLAEHDAHPHNAGRGWTKRAAKRRVERMCRAAIDREINEATR